MRAREKRAQRFSYPFCSSHFYTDVVYTLFAPNEVGDVASKSAMEGGEKHER